MTTRLHFLVWLICITFLARVWFCRHISWESFKKELESKISNQFRTQTLLFQAALSHPHEWEQDYRIFMVCLLYIGLRNLVRILLRKLVVCMLAVRRLWLRSSPCDWLYIYLSPIIRPVRLCQPICRSPLLPISVAGSLVTDRCPCLSLSTACLCRRHLETHRQHHTNHYHLSLLHLVGMPCSLYDVYWTSSRSSIEMPTLKICYS